MIKYFLHTFAILLIFTGFHSCSEEQVNISVYETTVNGKVAATGVSSPLQVAWKLKASGTRRSQSAYRIILAETAEALQSEKALVWNSGKVASEQSTNIIIDKAPLQTGKKYFLKVKVWDNDSVESAWSKTQSFVTALFTDESWNGAKWIALESMKDSMALVPGIPTWGHNTKGKAVRRAANPYFRKAFENEKEVASAYLFISGLGHYKAYLNGERISKDFMSPGWTDYRNTCLYNTYDVSGKIGNGENVLGIMAGTGFYNINNERYRKMLITYGMPKTIAKLTINYTDGTSQTVITDESWKTSPSPLVYSSIYGGETYDARKEQDGWNRAGFDDTAWQNALLAKAPGGQLKPEITYPVQEIETFAPLSSTPKGTDTVAFDFGQNASGIIGISLKGHKGDTVRVHPSEHLHATIRKSQKFTGGPHYYEYILKGDGIETFKPSFTYYGFRYAHVTGASYKENKHGSAPVITEIKMHHTSNTAPQTGTFSCSNPLFNQIDTLIRYAIKSNCQSVLSDCPHRERLGWIEQTHLMGNSVKFNCNMYHLYRKLVNDMLDSQREDGLIPSIAPEFIVFGGAFSDSPEWGSAIIQVPWLVYKWYGDISIIEKARSGMLRYLNYLDSKAEDNIISYGLGDWYDLGPQAPGFSQLSPLATTATGIYYQNYSVMTEMANLLGKTDEAESFAAKAEEIKKAYNNLLFDKDKNIYATGSQSAMAIPLALGMVPEENRIAVFNNLVDSILDNNKRITAGDIGFHYLIDALTEGNRSQLIYEMNNRDDVPGYGYQIKKGATALTESWEALPDKSNNHLMLGHIMEWFYTGLGGIRQAENSRAYKHIIIKPAFVDGLDWVNTSHETPYGKIVSNWQKQESKTEMRISIPVNTDAEVYIPTGGTTVVNGVPIDKNPSVIESTQSGNYRIIKVGSGKYTFEVSH